VLEGSSNFQNTTSIAAEFADIENSQFMVGLVFAMTLKLISSIDDVVWLVPFLIVEEKAVRYRNMVVYTSICLFQTIFALAIASGGVEMLDALKSSDDTWSSEKLFSFVAGTCLLIYGTKLLYEWYFEEHDDDEEDDVMHVLEEQQAHMNEDANKLNQSPPNSYNEKSILKNSSSSSIKYIELSPEKNDGNNDGNDDDDDFDVDNLPDIGRRRSSADMQHPVLTRSKSHSKTKEVLTKPHSKETHTTSALFIVAFLGSLDDLTLFVPMLVGQAIPWPSLIFGSMIAVSIILMICIFLGMCKPIARFLVAIPLFSIVLTFGTFLTIKALNMD